MVAVAGAVDAGEGVLDAEGGADAGEVAVDGFEAGDVVDEAGAVGGGEVAPLRDVEAVGAAVEPGGEVGAEREVAEPAFELGEGGHEPGADVAEEVVVGVHAGPGVAHDGEGEGSIPEGGADEVAEGGGGGVFVGEHGAVVDGEADRGAGVGRERGLDAGAGGAGDVYEDEALAVGDHAASRGAAPQRGTG